MVRKIAIIAGFNDSGRLFLYESKLRKLFPGGCDFKVFGENEKIKSYDFDLAVLMPAGRTMCSVSSFEKMEEHNIPVYIFAKLDFSIDDSFRWYRETAKNSLEKEAFVKIGMEDIIVTGGGGIMMLPCVVA